MDCGSCIDEQTQLGAFLTNFLFCRKWCFCWHFSRPGGGTVNSIVAPELSYRRRWFLKGAEQHRILNVYHGTTYSNWHLDGALSLDSFVLVTSAFWHRRKRFFSCDDWWKNTKYHKEFMWNNKVSPTKIYKERKKKSCFLIASVNPTFLWLSFGQYTAEPKPRKWWIICPLNWYILRLNEWFQACQIGWQVFIYCFTDNILHRVTSEVRSPDRTRFGFLPETEGEINIRSCCFFVFSSSTHCKQLSNI